MWSTTLVFLTRAQQAVDGYYSSTGMQETVQSPYGSPAFSPAPPPSKWAYMPRPIAYLKFNDNLDNSGTYAEITAHPETWTPPYCGKNSGGACVTEPLPTPPPPAPAASTPSTTPLYANGTVGCEYTVDTSRDSQSRCRQALSGSLVKLNRNPMASRDRGTWTFWLYANTMASAATSTIFIRGNAVSISLVGGASNFDVKVLLNTVRSPDSDTYCPESRVTAGAYNTWTHVSISMGDGSMSVYVNGAHSNTVTDACYATGNKIRPDSHTGVGAEATLTSYPTLGGRITASDGAITERFAGQIDDFAFWPQKLNADKVHSVYMCGVDTSESRTAVRAMGGADPNNTLVPHTGLTLAQFGYSLCATTWQTVTDQGGWWPHATVRQGDGNYDTQDTDWQGPFPKRLQGEWYLDNPHLKYRNLHAPHQGALHQLRARSIAVGGVNPFVASNAHTSVQITTGLNGEQHTWPYKLGANGVGRSNGDVYHDTSMTVDGIKLTEAQIHGHPGNGGPLHCDLADPGGGATCTEFPVIGLEASGNTYGYTTNAGLTQGTAVNSWDYTNWPNLASMEPTYTQAPVEGENGYMPTHTPHPTKQPDFYPSYGNHENGDSGELGSNEYPMTSLTDCVMHMSGSLALNTGTCMQPGYKLANGLHPGTYLYANN